MVGAETGGHECGQWSSGRFEHGSRPTGVDVECGRWCSSHDVDIRAGANNDHACRHDHLRSLDDHIDHDHINHDDIDHDHIDHATA